MLIDGQRLLVGTCDSGGARLAWHSLDGGIVGARQRRDRGSHHPCGTAVRETSGRQFSVPGMLLALGRTGSHRHQPEVHALSTCAKPLATLDCPVRTPVMAFPRVALTWAFGQLSWARGTALDKYCDTPLYAAGRVPLTAPWSDITPDGRSVAQRTSVVCLGWLWKCLDVRWSVYRDRCYRED